MNRRLLFLHTRHNNVRMNQNAARKKDEMDMENIPWIESLLKMNSSFLHYPPSLSLACLDIFRLVLLLKRHCARRSDCLLPMPVTKPFPFCAFTSLGFCL